MKLLLALAAVAATVAAVTATAAGQGPTPCPATFHVLHDDRIGSARLPEGMYQLTPTSLSCAQAAHLFAEFLKDYDGRLPRPWRFTSDNPGEVSFTRGTGPDAFDALRTGDITPGTPGHTDDGGGTHGALACTASFRVQHDDRIGALRLPAGRYRITLLGPRLTCAAAARLFTRFLDRPSGRLGGGWIVLPDAGEFVNGSTSYGFSVAPLSG
jgi:hypothetical protein